jgi:hypothetical protein
MWRPHLGIVGCGEAETCLCDDELLWCSSALIVGGRRLGDCPA